MKFIELTGDDSNKIYIEPSFIALMSVELTGTKVYTGNASRYVKETPEEIMTKIKEVEINGIRTT